MEMAWSGQEIFNLSVKPHHAFKHIIVNNVGPIQRTDYLVIYVQLYFTFASTIPTNNKQWEAFFFNTRDLRHQGLCITNVDVFIADDSEECIIYQWVSRWFQNHAASWFKRLTHLGLNWMVWYKKQESDLHIEWNQHIILMLPFYLWRQCSHFFFGFAFFSLRSSVSHRTCTYKILLLALPASGAFT